MKRNSVTGTYGWNVDWFDPWITMCPKRVAVTWDASASVSFRGRHGRGSFYEFIPLEITVDPLLRGGLCDNASDWRICLPAIGERFGRTVDGGENSRRSVGAAEGLGNRNRLNRWSSAIEIEGKTLFRRGQSRPFREFIDSSGSFPRAFLAGEEARILGKTPEGLRLVQVEAEGCSVPRAWFQGEWKMGNEKRGRRRKEGKEKKVKGRAGGGGGGRPRNICQ